LTIAGLSALAGQPEGVAFGLVIANFGADGMTIGGYTSLTGDVLESYSTDDPTWALAGGTSYATDQALEDAAAAAAANPVGPLVGNIVSDSVENQMTANDLSGGSCR
jgi:hypothetical protein